MTDPHGWQPIETAPKDGTPIRVKIPGFGDHLEVSWRCGFENARGEYCCYWVITDDFLYDLKYPLSWTEGVCWEDDDQCKHTAPTHWMPIMPIPKTKETDE